MSRVLPALLWLGWCLTQAARRNVGMLPQPRITAEPELPALKGSQVRLQCHKPPGARAEAYRIHRVGSREPTSWGSLQQFRKRAGSLFITEMMPDHAGRYHCSYRSGGRWSPHSNQVSLFMAGAYQKPSLRSITGPVVTAGAAVKLSCLSIFHFDEFILIREDAAHTQLAKPPTRHGRRFWAIFRLEGIASMQAGTYRCYGVFKSKPFHWSNPSDTLQLQINEGPKNPHPTEHRLLTEVAGNSVLLEPRHPTGKLTASSQSPQQEKAESATWAPSAENQVRLVLAGLVLLVLGVLLAEAWRSRNRTCPAPTEAPRAHTKPRAPASLSRLGTLVQHRA